MKIQEGIHSLIPLILHLTKTKQQLYIYIVYVKNTGVPVYVLHVSLNMSQLLVPGSVILPPGQKYRCACICSPRISEHVPVTDAWQCYPSPGLNLV